MNKGMNDEVRQHEEGARSAADRQPEEFASPLISRRKLLASIGAIGAAVTASTILTVNGDSVLLGKDDEKLKKKKQINDMPEQYVSTIADLKALNISMNGQQVRVLHYNSNIRWIDQLYIWDAASTETDADYAIISDNSITGRWIPVFSKGYIDPKVFGADPTGATDARLACEKAAVFARNLGKKWLVKKEDIFLLNSYANYSEVSSFSAGMIPLFSNVDYEIKGTLKVGAFFDNKDFIVFTDINGVSGNFTPVENYNIYGNGSIDLASAGKRIGGYKLRIPIYLETSYHAKIKDITIQNGDTPNAIVTGGEDIVIDGVKFKNLMLDNSDNDDHSTIYSKAKATKIANCSFEMTTVNGRLNACPVELHNSDSYFKDSTVYGYRNSHIIAAITVETPDISSIEVSGLKCKVHRQFSVLDVWTGATLLNVQVHDNIVEMLPFPTDAQISAAGLNPSWTRAPQAMVLTTNDSTIGYDLVAGNGNNINYYDNTYITSNDVNLPNSYKSLIHFYKAPCGGIHIYNNTVSVPRAVKSQDELASTNKLNLDSFALYDNHFDELSIDADAFVDLTVNTIQSSKIEFRFRRNVTMNKLIKIAAHDAASSVSNTFIVHPEFVGHATTCLDITQAVIENGSNKFSYPRIHGIYFGADPVGQADFYLKNAKRATLLDRVNLPESVALGGFNALNDANGRLTALVHNPDALFGTYDARVLVSNL